jgi:hypothetical protein
MMYLSINNKDYNNIEIITNKKYIYSLKYITPYISLYGVTFKINVKKCSILEKKIHVEIDKKNYEELSLFDTYMLSKINNYHGITFTKDGKYFIKLNNNYKILSKINVDVFYLWISKIKTQNYINYPIIYII